MFVWFDGLLVTGNCSLKTHIWIGDDGIIGSGDGMWAVKDLVCAVVHGIADESNSVTGSSAV